MSRWEPDALGRLQAAAIELYAEHGYEQTTVAEIAARAGLTERTYFRHFADKREVLFHGSEMLQEALVTALEEAPAGESPLDAIGYGLRRLGPFFDERRPQSLRRHAIIRSSHELQEREMLKRSSLVAALTPVLERRGVEPDVARLAAESGISVFHLAYESWVADQRGRGYAEHVDETLASLRALAAAPAAASLR
ncbi:MAG TPA: helix-turn-helix domain-containing protein [Solirubrobacteraceae bacterium]|nr:helix-turn-helix domain-containing protein [Solirubrobacteraceae bacterium]